ncbi:ABC transporter permease [[Clostridium] sordellii]|uniref:FtsX-like permease family protein n=1 Tax=Paraclostridium sordellii TaxID=1505 RepID=UPI0005E5043F|nr:FtsX-like permease family protein [Paeniclostridium sordellii]CEP45485.1 ABC transporter permease [[Clostridium] sordellii] [Paeniclostridium sordellii]
MKLNDIVIRYIQRNRKNTLIIIMSIIISTALFLLMNIISEDARNIMIDQSKKELGTKHISYNDPTNKDVKNIENNPTISKVGKTMLLGLHSVGKGQTLQILSDDKIAQEIDNGYTLKSGKFPTEDNEITIDSWYIEQKNIKNPIGKKISLNYSKPDESGKILYSGEKEFKIVGIIDSNPALKAQGTSIGVISENCAIQNIPLKNKYSQVMCIFKNEKNIQKQAEKLIASENLNKNNLELNKPLILAMSDSLSLKIPYITISIVLALATILLIYNIFYILVSNRTKDFGTLRAVGFIPSDILKIMFLEIIIYISISIPIGLLLGGLISNMTREYIIAVIYNIKYVNSIKSNSYINIYIITSILSIVTVLIAVYKPLITSIKTDPMVCIRKNKEKIKIKSKSVISKIMTKLFKDYGKLASKNIQRNKKRTVLVISSMVIVFFLMMIVYTKSTSNFLDNGGMRLWIPGDYLINNIDIPSNMQNEKSYDKKTLKAIESINGIKKVNASRNKLFSIQVADNKINKESMYWKRRKDVLNDCAEVKNGVKFYNNDIEVIGIENTDLLDDVLIDGKENLEKFKKSPYIYIDKETSKALNIKKGDTINIKFDTIDPRTGNFIKTLSKNFKIGGIVKYVPITSQGGGASFGGVISIPQMNKFTGISSYERFDIWTSKLANDKYIESELGKIVKNSGKGILIPYKNESSVIEKSDNQKTMIITLVIGVIIILSLFNCCNTLVTSINSRSREFALFRAIGISNKEIKKMVQLEGLIYISVSFIISIVPTLIVRSIIIKDFENIRLISLKFILATMLIVVILIYIIFTIISKTLKNEQDKDFIDQINTLQ